MLAAFAILGFVVLPGVLGLDLLAPGRHFGSARSRARLAAGGVAALSVALGIAGALARLLGGGTRLSASAAVIALGVLAGPFLDRTLGEHLDRLVARTARGPRLVTPALWLDDGLRRLAWRSLFAGLVFFGALRLPAAVGLAATLVFVATSVKAVAEAVATPVGFEERAREPLPAPEGVLRAGPRAA